MTHNPITRWLYRLAILSITALAFGLRTRYLSLFTFHIDEFFTLAAANLIAETGLPRYPTGLVYDPGLPYSYLAGLLFWLNGFSEAMGRWPAVLFGTLAVVTVYWLGARVLRSQTVGLLAALWLALSADSVEWGGRARMISLAQWLALLSVGLLWVGLSRPSIRHRLAFVFGYGLTLLTHFATVVLLPAWFVAAAALWWLRAISFQRRLIWDGLLLFLVSGLALSSGAVFQPPPSVEFQAAEAGLDAKVGALGGKFLQIPSDVGHAWKNYSPYFLDGPHWAILALALLGLAVSTTRLIRLRRSAVSRQPSAISHKPDTGAIYFGVIFLTVLGVLALVIDPHWQRARYLVMQALGVFYLLGAHGLRMLVMWLPLPKTRRPMGRGAVATLTLVLLLIPFRQPLAWSLDAGYIGWDRYDLAAQFAADNMVDGDKVMTMHPPINTLYLNGQSDYYLVQNSPKLILRPDGLLGDRYTGAIWVQDADEFHQVVSAPDRLWLVVQEFWLFNSYDGYLQQNILQRMDKVWGEGGVWALAARPGTWPLAREMETPVGGEFANGVRLAGYTAQPNSFAPGNTIHLTLFWQGERLPNSHKIFVHLRDAANNTVAQADHFIYDGKVPNSRWASLFEQDPLLRDAATLTLSPDLPPGPYRLMIGFYHPQTFERIGVIDDQSGESAVVVAEVVME